MFVWFGDVGLFRSTDFGLVWLTIEAILNEQNLCLIIVDIGTSGEEGKRNLEYFQQQKLPQLRECFQKRDIQSSSEGKVDDNGVGMPRHHVV